MRQLRKLFDSLEPFMAHTKRKPAKKAPAKRKPTKAAPKRKAPPKAARKPTVTKKTPTKAPVLAKFAGSLTGMAGGTVATSQSVPERIISKAVELGGSQRNDVRLAKLRAALPGISRTAFDTALLTLQEHGHIALYREDNTFALTDADKAAALELGNPDAVRHLLYVLPSGAQLVDPGAKEARKRSSESDERKLLAALKKVAAGEPKGSLLQMKLVRAEAGLTKKAFDDAAIRLQAARRITMHYHDFPSSVTKAVLEQYVFDEAGNHGQGVYYLGIAPNEPTNKSVVVESSSDSLHARIAKALGWTVKEAQSFSLPALRDLVRPVSPKLAEEITLRIQH